MLRLSLLTKLIVPALVGVAGLFLVLFFRGNWAIPFAYFLCFVLAAWITTQFRRNWIRNTALVGASVMLFLTVAETYALVVYNPSVLIQTAGFTRLDPVLGWGPRPGIGHQTKYDLKTGTIVADADYTIEPRGIRKTISAPSGPTVAFFGDSMTFGQWLPDSETMPQLFADLTGRRMHVLNLAVSSYGPQQFLRALETDLFKDILGKPQLFVYMTSQWHAERTSCKLGFVMLAPRYKLVDGRPQFQGPCLGLIYGLLARTAIYKAFVEPAVARVGPGDLDLYIAILTRAGEIAREKYGVPTVILYLPDPAYARQSGWSDDQIMQRLRDGGLKVIDVTLNPSDFPGQQLEIPGDGHPTGVANLARAKMLYNAFDDLVRPESTIGSISAAAPAAPCAKSACFPSSN
jgi:hypothetical protein